jgi:hypothetical protein
MGEAHPFSLFLPYVHFVLGTVVVFMGRDDDGGQRKTGTLKNEHGCSFLSVKGSAFQDGLLQKFG